MSKIIRLIRVIEYIGPEKWVMETLRNSINGQVKCGEGLIRTSMVPQLTTESVIEVPDGPAH